MPEKQLNKIYVGNLPVNTREDDLEGCFGEMGRILGVELKYVVGGSPENSRQAHGNASTGRVGYGFVVSEGRALIQPWRSNSNTSTGIRDKGAS